MDTTENPHAGSIVERIHQTLAKIVRTKILEDQEDLEFDWTGVLYAAAYGIRSTYHTTPKVIPGKLVFG